VTRWAALLRGVNVGGGRRVVMADLRSLLTSLGYEAVQTLLNSGNAVFSSSGRAPAIQRTIEAALASELGVECKVLLRSGRELDAVVRGNPFPVDDVTKIGVAFLSAEPDSARLRSVGDVSPEAFAVGDRVLYLQLPFGFGRSKLPDWQKVLGLTVTARNWATTSKLRDLTN
jgi:uncharacterized protein (DUF1697 family)